MPSIVGKLTKGAVFDSLVDDNTVGATFTTGYVYYSDGTNLVAHSGLSYDGAGRLTTSSSMGIGFAPHADIIPGYDNSSIRVGETGYLVSTNDSPRGGDFGLNLNSYITDIGPTVYIR